MPADTAFPPLPRLADRRGAVGKARVRRGGRAKVTGTAPYTAEWDGRHARTPHDGGPDLSGLLHAVAVPAVVAKGKIVGVDASAAESMAGVKFVLTPSNSPDVTVPKGPPGLSFQSLEPAKTTDLLHAGQYAAAVIADTFTAARDAALAVKIAYEADENPLIDVHSVNGSEERPPSLMGFPPVHEQGDPQTALKDAPHKVDRQYETAFNHHNPIEPHATVAAFGKSADGTETLAVYETTQNLYGTRDELAKAFDLEPEQVTVVNEFVARGVRGSKGAMWPQALLACKCAKLSGKPVKLVVTRRQLYGGTGHRSPTIPAGGAGGGGRRHAHGDPPRGVHHHVDPGPNTRTPSR